MANNSSSHGFNDVLLAMAGWLTFAMILTTFVGTVLRYVGRHIGTNLTWSAAVDMQWYLFSVIFLSLASYNLFKDKNVRVDIFYSKLSVKAKSLVDFLGIVFFILPFSALIIYVSWPFVANSVAVFESSPDPGGLPRWIIKPLIPIAFLMVFLQSVCLGYSHAKFVFGFSNQPPHMSLKKEEGN